MCTGLRLAHNSKGSVYARTLEFGQDLRSQLLFIPRAYALEAPNALGANGGLCWKSTYAAIGANAFGMPCFVDGVNEKGLAGGLFYFPDYAQYQQIQPADYGQSIPMWQLLTLLLTSCATVEDVRKTLQRIFVSNAPLPGTKESIPAHVIMLDATETIVIEYVKGALHIHDNPLGIITNAPTFDWHMTNLKNYINLSAVNAPDRTVAGITLSPLGQGSGMLGIPGDFTPPSRFVRIAAYVQATMPLANAQEAIDQAFHMLHSFDIPKGTVRDRNGIIEYTLWTSAIDMQNKIFYIKPHAHHTVHLLQLTKLDLNAQTTQSFDLKEKEHFSSVLNQ